MATIKEMESKLASLKQQRKEIDLEISQVEKVIKEMKQNKLVSSSLDKNNYKLFQYYVVEVKKLRLGTFKDYCSALKDMQRMLSETYDYVFDFSFIELDDPILFNKLINKFENSADLVAEKRRRHHDISAAYNNYYSFLLSKRG